MATPLEVELAMQRRNTQAFIEASPVELVLVPHTDVKTPSGGVVTTPGTPRVPQRFRLIPMSSVERPSESTNGGEQRKYDMTLLGNWDCVMDIGDEFSDVDGNTYVIDALVPFNNYERKGLVTSYGRRGRIV